MHFDNVEERIDRLEKTVAAAVDLLHALLHPDKGDQARHAGEALMGEMLPTAGPTRLRRRGAAELHEDGAAGARVRRARRTCRASCWSTPASTTTSR